MKIFEMLRCTVMTLLALGLLFNSTACDRSNSSRGGPATPFQVNQVWSYRTRPNETASKLVICAIEYDSKAGKLVHVLITDLKMRNPRSPSGISDTVFHAPFTEAALRASVVEVVALAQSQALPPQWQQGYAQWRAAYDAGQGGVWNMPVADAVAAMEADFLKAPAPATAESGLQLFGASTLPTTEPATMPTTSDPLQRR
jgi:hypothetical protein